MILNLKHYRRTSMWMAAAAVLFMLAACASVDQGAVRTEIGGARTALAQACFGFLPTRGELDLLGWTDPDIFAH